MFRENNRHLQISLFDTVQQLAEKVRQGLENSWAGAFYREVFCRIDEAPSAVLYSDQPSRPNVPINILVGVEILKAGFGWSDEELYDQIGHAKTFHTLSESRRSIPAFSLSLAATFCVLAIARRLLRLVSKPVGPGILDHSCRARLS